MFFGVIQFMLWPENSPGTTVDLTSGASSTAMDLVMAILPALATE